ncbi:MAG: ATP-binding cassette domain-containing protein [Bacteroidales bacterium]|nr:MAG: ATP-binding cassette domain-containing protein [Bacteroidales bacterium]
MLMNESILKALIQLFANVVDVDRNGISPYAREVVEAYLENEFSSEQVTIYLKQFDSYLSLYHPPDIQQQSSDTYNYPISERISEICSNINNEFEQHQKVWLILQLIEFIGDSRFDSPNKLDFIKSVAVQFNISEFEFNNGKDFILCQDSSCIPWNGQILLIDGNKDNPIPEIKHLYNEKIRGQVFVLHIASTNTFLVKYFGENDLFLNSRNLKPGRAYIFGAGGVIRNQRINPIYYSKIASAFIQDMNKAFITLNAYNIEYKHKGSTDGIHPFTFGVHSGQLIGIMGGSGVGKSTLINILNGNLKPADGSIIINGYDLHKDKRDLEGLIGYVPQDDLLIEELTVYQNLYFSACLCFSKFTDSQIRELVDKTILDFDLLEARDLKVGDPINKFISGGQRKRLNIAIELLREPGILFVDEPTSGLSSMDSERVILMLKKQTFKGKIVFANIHQPSSDIFKLFDKIIVLDHGGRVIYQGNPMGAVVYFKRIAHYLKAEESECLTCGNVNTEQILRIVEARVVNEYGKLTRKRKRSAQDWYELYKKTIESKIVLMNCDAKSPLPQSGFSIPSRKRQMWIFFKRNLFSKMVNKQFMYISLVAAPLLAIILGFFTKFIGGTVNNPNEYIFSNNDNIPSYLFMSVVATLFLGLTISAEDIIRDRKVRQRERFLNLSYFSYINSKVLVLIIFSAIQSFLFVIVGNSILEIQGMLFSHWLILFSTAVCANLMGLNISAALNSVVAIYVMIPLILVPQLLFSGVIVNYNKLHKTISNPEVVPFLGDVMLSRWSYEALCVHQFSSNEFEKEFFSYNKELSTSTYYASFLIPKIQILLDESLKDIILNKRTPHTLHNLKVVQNEVALLSRDYPIKDLNYPDTSSLNPNGVSLESIHYVKDVLNRLRNHFNALFQRVNQEKDAHYEELAKRLGGDNAVYKLSLKYNNKALNNLLLNTNELTKVEEVGDRLIRRYNPIYASPTTINGRANLFAPEKRYGSLSIPTFWFNTMAIWFMSFVFYLFLWFNILRMISSYMERFKFRRLARRIARYIPR